MDCKLVQVSQRRKDQLLPYDTELVSGLLLATNDLVEDAKDIVQGANNSVQNVYSNQPEAGLKSAFLMHHLRIQRQKRALLIYHHERLGRLRAIVDKYGNAGIPENIRECLSVEDNEYVLAYRRLLQKFNVFLFWLIFQKRGNPALDLVNYNPDPPKKMLVCVKGIFPIFMRLTECV